MPFLPCPSCARHVRTADAACPFCRIALDLRAVRAPPSPSVRLGRAALVAFAASACTPGTTAPAYGGPPPPPLAPTGEVPTPSAVDAGPAPEVGPVPLHPPVPAYGAPPPRH